MKKRIIVSLVAFLLILATVVPANAQELQGTLSQQALLKVIEKDSGLSFSNNAEIYTYSVLEESADGEKKEIKQIAVNDVDQFGNGCTTFIIPFEEDEDNILHRVEAVKAPDDTTAGVMGGSDTYTLTEGSVNVYLRAYYTRSTAGGLYYLFRPSGADMRCTYSSGSVTDGYVGLGLFGELYYTAVDPPTIVNEYFTYRDPVYIGNMTSNVTYYRATEPLLANRAIYVGNGGLPGCQFVLMWSFKYNNVEYDSKGYEEVWVP